MLIRVQFFSYFKDLAGLERTSVQMPPGSTLSDLWKQVKDRFPKLAPAGNSALIAVGVEYQPKDYSLKENDEVSFFPPVQGG